LTVFFEQDDGFTLLQPSKHRSETLSEVLDGSSLHENILTSDGNHCTRNLEGNLEGNNAPWVLLDPRWLSCSSVVLPVVAGVLGLRNHLHALTAVMICLTLMIARMHAVSAASLEPVTELLNGVESLVHT